MESIQGFLFLNLAVGASAATAPDPNGTNVTAASKFCPDDWFYEYAAGLCYKVRSAKTLMERPELAVIFAQLSNVL